MHLNQSLSVCWLVSICVGNRKRDSEEREQASIIGTQALASKGIPRVGLEQALREGGLFQTYSQSTQFRNMGTLPRSD
jgi:hypothetical protein